MGVIEQRKFIVCPTEIDYDFSLLFVECDFCDRLFASCCTHKSYGGELYRTTEEGGRCCHFSKLVFTDGACSNNGLDSAKAGLGITIGSSEEYCWSIPVTDALDPAAVRTNQRAELLAAIEGLKKLEDRFKEDHYGSSTTRVPPKRKRREYIVVTDSEYVAKGITEWFPTWRSRGWRTSSGKQPTNLDLFLKLDEEVTRLEQDCAEVGFWQVPRAFNVVADGLAKRATRD